ncbi:MAG: hypothetical protein EXS37_03325 [Opitutus sp.]|nr:hypothetical protein [Opitutus sp.]
MTTRRAIIVSIALLAIAVVIWRMANVAPGTLRTPSAAPATAPDQSAVRNPKSEIPLERSALADDLNLPATDIRSDLRVVSEVIHAFQTNFPRDGNPVGTNAEITAALTGKNRLRLALVPPDHPAINRAGELCDRWGTPFFFHAENATKMEIRSAGPDKKMWNDDDVVFSP